MCASIPMLDTTGWPNHPVLYEINTWPWLREMSAAAGRRITLADVPQFELERIVALGFDGVWLMGVWERSPQAREMALSIPDLLSAYQRALPDFTAEDVVGSPYAIYRYEVDAALGGREALTILRERLRQLGLRLVLDFVPNHLTIGHPWPIEYPDRFVQGTADRLVREPQNYFMREIGGTPRIFAHGRDPNYNGWTDTVQLDYRSRDTRCALCEVLAGIAEQCDGVRCDMAMLVIRDVFVRTWGGEFDPPDADFWSDAIGTVKAKHPGFIFIGEVYWDLEYRLQQLGFDYTYDKRLYDRLVDGDAASIRAHLGASFDFQRRLTRFIENHDEPRAATALGPERSRAAAVLALTLPGMRLVHEGQIEGRRVRIPVQLGRRPAEPSDLVIQTHYERLLRALSDPLFHEGTWRLLDPQPAGTSESYRGFIAHRWSSRDAVRLVTVNWSPDQAQCFLPLHLPVLGGCSWQLRDLLSAAACPRGGDERLSPGLYLDMPAWSYHLFELQTCE
jgi:Alpha amylase, catalytic domain